MSGAFIIFHNIFVQWHRYEWDMGPGMIGWGFGWGWYIVMVAFWIAVIMGIVFLAQRISKKSVSGHERMKEDSALEILKKRYARGEISKEEFEEKKRDLEI